MDVESRTHYPNAQTWIGDAVVAWRCYVVWQRNKIILFVVVALVLASAITGYVSVITEIAKNLGETNVLVTTMLATSLVTNIVISALTAGKIWAVSRQIGSHRVRTSRNHYLKIITLIVESGVVLAFVEMLELVIFENLIHSTTIPSGGVFLVAALLPQLLVRLIILPYFLPT
jgi:hypothetical protein